MPNTKSEKMSATEYLESMLLWEAFGKAHPKFPPLATRNIRRTL